MSQHFSLYYYDACPYCQRVLSVINNIDTQVEKRNVQQNRGFHAELNKEGGRTTVPCLRIEQEGQVQWMYESSDIIRYLKSL